MPENNPITGIILAGGKGLRMGGVEKGLLVLDGKPLIEHVIARIRPQVGPIIINANRHLDRYARYGYPLAQDLWPDFRGPLAGLLSALPLVRTPYILCVPCDAPFLPDDLTRRLMVALEAEQAQVSAATVAGDLQAVCFLARREALDDLQDYLGSGQRKVQDWLAARRLAITDFSDCAMAFANINTRGELQQAAVNRPIWP
ncbi:MAG: molybdenum cofactor guanylyltransferase [Gammaproteobacteria bacterium RBG_16_57_12]|nr:MAG: molybdenum cofactor guanylyltransferase [Gammaproteobacteria bacterium RBG_16_57_12]